MEKVPRGSQSVSCLPACLFSLTKISLTGSCELQNERNAIVKWWFRFNEFSIETKSSYECFMHMCIWKNGQLKKAFYQKAHGNKFIALQTLLLTLSSLSSSGQRQARTVSRVNWVYDLLPLRFLFFRPLFIRSLS